MGDVTCLPCVVAKNRNTYIARGLAVVAGGWWSWMKKHHCRSSGFSLFDLFSSLSLVSLPALVLSFAFALAVRQSGIHSFANDNKHIRCLLSSFSLFLQTATSDAASRERLGARSFLIVIGTRHSATGRPSCNFFRTSLGCSFLDTDGFYPDTRCSNTLDASGRGWIGLRSCKQCLQGRRG